LDYRLAVSIAYRCGLKLKLKKQQTYVSQTPVRFISTESAVSALSETVFFSEIRAKLISQIAVFLRFVGNSRVDPQL
jgi:hypothetical protein